MRERLLRMDAARPLCATADGTERHHWRRSELERERERERGGLGRAADRAAPTQPDGAHEHDVRERTGATGPRLPRPVACPPIGPRVPFRVPPANPIQGRTAITMYSTRAVQIFINTDMLIGIGNDC